MKLGNVIIGQSGGPTSVINASLAGAYKTAKDGGANRIYGMLNGVQGLLQEQYIDLSEHIRSDIDLELLKRTPSSFLGSCRFKLPDISDEELYNKLFKILRKLEIKYFFYIGGNDSMDTINKLHKYAQKHKHDDIKFMGIPKTIDNDLAITDHTPGYGSAAKYIGATIKELIRDALVYNNQQVTVVEIMGRNAGWLTAAAALAKTEECDGPDMILLPEVPLNLNKFLEKMARLREKKNSILIAVSEGVKNEEGTYICELTRVVNKGTDSFGHKSLGGTAAVLASIIAERFGCKVRPIELSTLQRCASHIASNVDVTEAFQAGGCSVGAAFAGKSGEMPVFVRTSTEPYAMKIELMDVNKIANFEKKVPAEWITNEGTYVSDELVKNILPLIQGEVTPVMVNGLPRHLVLNLKK